MKRNYHMDNAKFFLVCMVVIVHFISPTGGNLSINDAFLKNTFIFLMLFIMPAFAMVSGYFSKDTLSHEDLKKSIITLIIPYLIFETLFYFGPHASHPTIYLEPVYYLWYLPALFAWRLMLPIFVNFKYPVILSILISIAVGYSSKVNYFLTLSRIFYFFPYFLVGYFMKKKIDFTGTFLVKFLAALILFLICANIFILSPPYPAQKWILGSYSYNLLGVENGLGGLIRVMLYPITLIAAFSFFYLVPKNKTLFSDIGARSIYPYILQFIAVALLVKSGMYKQLSESSLFFKMLLIPAGFFATVILSSSIFVNVFRFFIQPDYVSKFIFKKPL